MSMSINSAMPPVNAGLQNQSTQSLSKDQLNTIDSVLSNFDLNALTEEDAKSIVQAFSEAGIEPGKALESTLSNYGIDAKALGDLAGVGPASASAIEGATNGSMPPPPPPQSSASASGSSLNQDNLSLLQSILDQYSNLDNLSTQEENQLSQSLFDAGLLEPGALVNTKS